MHGLAGHTGRARAPFIWWAFATGAAITSFVIFLTLQVGQSFDETQALRAEVIRSYEMRAELGRVLSLHQDLETGERGFLLTGDPRFLEPYQTANRQVQSSLDRLAQRGASDPQYVRELTLLNTLSALQRHEESATIASAQGGGMALARQQIANGSSKKLMDAIRASVASLDDHERERLSRRTALAQQARAQLRERIVVLEVILIVMLGIALGLLLRAYQAWQRTLSRELDLAARQQAIFTAARDGMLMIDDAGIIESLNPAAAKMFGYGRDELVTCKVDMLFDVPPDKGKVQIFLKRLLDRQQTARDQVQDFVGRCKDGSVFPTAVTVSPVKFGDQTRFLGVIRDVSGRIQVDRMKTEFVSTVSHELRTPLTSIAGSLGLISGGAAGQLPAPAQRLVQIAQSNCARLIRLINDILDIEKIEAGKMTFETKSVSLDGLLKHAVEVNKEFAAAHGVELKLESIAPGAFVLADEDRLMQVFTNLFSNAAKFSPRGSSVRIQIETKGQRYRISVADKGPGIPEAFRERIFTKFAQADSSDTRSKGGTGLGLSIVREIVSRLGGSVSFDSVPGQGATFHVDLRAAPHDVDSGKLVQPLGRISSADLPLVLHVDDDPDMLRIVAGAFEGHAQVHSSPSVMEARASLQRYSFDAVILDIGMADGNGLDLLPVIKTNGQAAVVVFTAQDPEPHRVKEADRVFVKSRDDLDRVVDQVTRLGARCREIKL